MPVLDPLAMKRSPTKLVSDADYSEEETARRAEAVIRRMAETPPQPQRPARANKQPREKPSRSSQSGSG